MGHVTITAADTETAVKKADLVKKWLKVEAVRD
jgi:hypothetical protein